MVLEQVCVQRKKDRRGRRGSDANVRKNQIEKIWHQGNRDTVFGVRWDVNVLLSAREDGLFVPQAFWEISFPFRDNGGGTDSCKIAEKKTNDGP